MQAAASMLRSASRLGTGMELASGALPLDTAVQPTWAAHDGKVNEGLTIPAQVNFVAKADDLYGYGYQLDAFSVEGAAAPA